MGARVQNERACLDAVALQELDTLVTADLDRIPAKPTAGWAWSISATAVAAAARRRQAVLDAADLRQEAVLRATERGRQTRGSWQSEASRCDARWQECSTCQEQSRRAGPMRSAGVMPPAGNDKLHDAGCYFISVESPLAKGGCG